MLSKSKGFEALTKTGLNKHAVETAALCAQGLSNAEIAEQRFLSVKTIKWHLNMTYKKLGLKNRSQLILWVVNNS